MEEYDAHVAHVPRGLKTEVASVGCCVTLDVITMVDKVLQGVGDTYHVPCPDCRGAVVDAKPSEDVTIVSSFTASRGWRKRMVPAIGPARTAV